MRHFPLDLDVFVVLWTIVILHDAMLLNIKVIDLGSDYNRAVIMGD